MLASRELFALIDAAFPLPRASPCSTGNVREHLAFTSREHLATHVVVKTLLREHLALSENVCEHLAAHTRTKLSARELANT